jgi:hypothetical protein
LLILYGWLAFLGFSAAFAVAAVLLNRGVRRGGGFVTVAFVISFGLGGGAIASGLILGAAAGWNLIALGILIVIFSLWRLNSRRQKPGAEK